MPKEYICQRVLHKDVAEWEKAGWRVVPPPIITRNGRKVFALDHHDEFSCLMTLDVDKSKKD